MEELRRENQKLKETSEQRGRRVAALQHVVAGFGDKVEAAKRSTILLFLVEASLRT